VDEVTDAAITTTLLDGTRVGARFEASSVIVSLGLPPHGDVRDLPPVIAAVRRWLDLDATPARIDDHFAGIAPVAAWVQRRPGMRVPAAADPFRSVVATIMGQQVSVGAAATLNARLIAHCGLTDRFPTAERLAACDADVLAHAVGIPATRARTLVTVAELVAGGGVELGPSADRDATVATLGSVRGVGPWTVAEVRMRALGDPDVWPAGDLILWRGWTPWPRPRGGPIWPITCGSVAA
jgi:AraC family transcriptional regulator of adaptative response / DNA-3-methyladenine glycosylase II